MISTAPGTLVRWSAPGTTRCSMKARSWAAVRDACYCPVELEQARNRHSDHALRRRAYCRRRINEAMMTRRLTKPTFRRSLQEACRATTNSWVNSKKSTRRPGESCLRRLVGFLPAWICMLLLFQNEILNGKHVRAGFRRLASAHCCSFSALVLSAGAIFRAVARARCDSHRRAHRLDCIT
jgi:hypothetical protein